MSIDWKTSFYERNFLIKICGSWMIPDFQVFAEAFSPYHDAEKHIVWWFRAVASDSKGPWI